mgnify:CR=1 FL=1
MRYLLIISLFLLSLQCSREPYSDQKEKLIGKWSEVTKTGKSEYVFKKNGEYTRSEDFDNISSSQTGEYEFLEADFVKLKVKTIDGIESDSIETDGSEIDSNPLPLTLAASLF